VRRLALSVLALSAALATPDQAAPLAAKIDDLRTYGFTGVGLGTDTGGFAALPAPESDAATNPEAYLRTWERAVSAR
jgi:hypothetical protein